MVKTEGETAVKEVKAFLDKSKKPDLIITDVPIETLKQFKDFANSDEFRSEKSSGHYGFALKFLLDYYFGRIPDGLTELEEEVMVLNERIAEITANHKPEAKVIRNVCGDKLRIGG